MQTQAPFEIHSIYFQLTQVTKTKSLTSKIIKLSNELKIVLAKSFPFRTFHFFFFFPFFFNLADFMKLYTRISSTKRKQRALAKSASSTMNFINTHADNSLDIFQHELFVHLIQYFPLLPFQLYLIVTTHFMFTILKSCRAERNSQTWDQPTWSVMEYL